MEVYLMITPRRGVKGLESEVPLHKEDSGERHIRRNVFRDRRGGEISPRMEQVTPPIPFSNAVLVSMVDGEGGYSLEAFADLEERSNRPEKCDNCSYSGRCRVIVCVQDD